MAGCSLLAALEGMEACFTRQTAVPYRLQTVLLGAVGSHVRALRDASQSFSYKRGAACCGGIVFVYVCLEYSSDPSEDLFVPYRRLSPKFH